MGSLTRVFSKPSGIWTLVALVFVVPGVWAAGGDIVDDFNRPGPGLGPNWAADPEYQIVNNELANVTGQPPRVEYIATYVAVSNPAAVAFRWSPSSDVPGRNQAGFALRLGAATPDTSGYLLYRDDPRNGFPNQWILVRIIGGVWSGILERQLTNSQVPEANDVIRVVLSSDSNGHHFDLFVNDVYDTRITDPDRVTGNESTWYAGFMSAGGMNNRIDDFTLALAPGTPPAPFALIAPPDGAVDVPQQPNFEWQSAGNPQILYTVYVATDSLAAVADSASLAGTTLQWPNPLPPADWVWRVRATNGQVSLFNSGGWYRFRTAVSDVEITSLSATGEEGQIVLRWTTSREEDHVGFHLWRAAGEESDGDEGSRYILITRDYVEPQPGEAGELGIYEYADRGVTPGVGYSYRVEAIDRFGTSQWFGPVHGVARAPSPVLALAQNSPNPFPLVTAIGFDLTHPARVEVSIRDVTGRPLRTLVDGPYLAGRHFVLWDGTDENGNDVGSGVFIYGLRCGERLIARKMLRLR